MKFIHLSDLHIGKRIYEHSLAEDQKFILDSIAARIKDISPDAVFIAGDVYDKPVPSADAVSLFDGFLRELAKTKAEIFIISGNHDSAERLAFASYLIDRSGIHFSPVFDGKLNKHTMTDAFGEVDIYMLPFIRTYDVNRYYPDSVSDNISDAVKTVIDNSDIDRTRRNILLAHLFVSGSQFSGSESSVGGLDAVSPEVFGAFGYTALGHLHRAQSISDSIRYCGTPMKYDFSEAGQTKSFTVGEMDKNGKVTLETTELKPLYDMICVKDSFAALSTGSGSSDYVKITLTDDAPVIDAARRLGIIYPRLMELSYAFEAAKLERAVGTANASSPKAPIDIFAELFAKQNPDAPELDDEKRAILAEIIKKASEAAEGEDRK